VRRIEGLTIIEVLIALSLLGVMTSLIVSSLTGSFALTRDSRRTLDATTNLQRIVEEIRGQWRQRGFYNAGCVKNVHLNPANAAFLSVSVESRTLELSTTNPADSVLPVTGKDCAERTDLELSTKRGAKHRVLRQCRSARSGVGFQSAREQP
jgi:type II secretory pathway pseudopilin PulG